MGRVCARLVFVEGDLLSVSSSLPPGVAVDQDAPEHSEAVAYGIPATKELLCAVDERLHNCKCEWNAAVNRWLRCSDVALSSAGASIDQIM